MLNVVVNSRFLTQPITGVQRFAIEICRELKKQVPDTMFISPKNIIHQGVARELDVETVGVLKGHLWEQIELPLFLNKKKGQPLLLNLCNTAPIFYKNKVVTLYDLAFYHYPEWFSPVFSSYYCFLIPKILRTSRHVFTDSQFIKNEIVEVYGVSTDDISVVYGAPAKFFSEDGGMSTLAYILAVGSIDPRKNLINLIKSFNNLALPGIRLIVVGQKNRVFSDESIEKLANENQSIEFTGYVSDNHLVRLYRDSLVFIYPSAIRGFWYSSS
jgi:glycosyltransferase involved in cell wall biosynthesis